MDEILFQGRSYPAGVFDDYHYDFYETEFSLWLAFKPISNMVLKVDFEEGRFTEKSYQKYLRRNYPVIEHCQALDPVAGYPAQFKLRHDYLEQDTAEAMNQFERFMEEFGFAWFERYSDPLNISRDANDPIGRELGSTEGHPLVSQHDARACVGFAAACVAEPQRVPELYAQWLEWARADDAYHIDTRGELMFEPRFRQMFDIILEEARKLGYDVPRVE